MTGAEKVLHNHPGFIQRGEDNPPFIRPEWTGDSTVYQAGWFWENLDGDRFYFPTREAAAEDAAPSLDYGDD